MIQDHPDNIDALHYRASVEFTSHGDLNQAIQDLLTVRGRVFAAGEQPGFAGEGLPDDAAVCVGGGRV